MPFQTPLTDLLGTKYPILGGTMMDLSKAPFVAAISDAGALGILASAIYKDIDLFRADVKAVQDKTDQPFAVNINLFPMMDKLDNYAYLDVMEEEGVKIMETSGFAPDEDLITSALERGFTWLHKCVGVRYALKAEALGAHAVTVVGYENGGATGNLNIGSLVLVPSVVDALKVPVIGGGGVIDGRSLLAMFALGAKGAIVGTRLFMSEECPAHRKLKEALLEADELSTDIIMRSVGFAHRVWMNEPSKKVAEIEARGGGIEEIYPYVAGDAARRMYEEGEVQAGSISISQGIGLVPRIMPVKDIIESMVADAERLHGGIFT